MWLFLNRLDGFEKIVRALRFADLFALSSRYRQKRGLCVRTREPSV